MPTRPLTAHELTNHALVEDVMNGAIVAGRIAYLDAHFDAVTRASREHHVEPYRSMTPKARAVLRQEHRELFPWPGDDWTTHLAPAFVERIRKSAAVAMEMFENGGFRKGRAGNGLRPTYRTDAPPVLRETTDSGMIKETRIDTIPPMVVMPKSRALEDVMDPVTFQMRPVPSWRFWPKTSTAMVVGTPQELVCETFEVPRAWPADEFLDRVRWAPGRPVVVLQEGDPEPE